MSEDNESPQKSGFEVLPAGEMQRKYGLTAENRPVIKLDASKVPERLRNLIPLAEEFGIGDDLVRADVVAKTPAVHVLEMRAQVEAHQVELEEWLAGPTAQGPDFSEEYVAFTCLQMAADGC